MSKEHNVKLHQDMADAIVEFTKVLEVYIDETGAWHPCFLDCLADLRHEVSEELTGDPFHLD